MFRKHNIHFKTSVMLGNKNIKTCMFCYLGISDRATATDDFWKPGARYANYRHN